MKYLTLKQKRFLIVWFLIHSVALLVNILQMSFYSTFDGNGKFGLIYYLTNTDEDTKKTELLSHFWPFLNPFIDEPLATGFHGLFCYYDISEFLIYVIGAILFFPLKKIWRGEPLKQKL